MSYGSKEQCCERDHNHDGNCDIHSAPGVLRLNKQRTNDLVGDPLPETPSMTTPLAWRVFHMNDIDWWLARTLDEAKSDYTRQTGDEDLDDAYELTDEELDRLHFVDTDERERPVTKSRRTFREELAQRVASGVNEPELFACTEY